MKPIRVIEEFMERTPVDFRHRSASHEWAGIVIHHTGIGNRNPDDVSSSTWNKLFRNIGRYLQRDDDRYVSCHYIIGREGECDKLLDPELYIAWHAGKSSFWHPWTRKWTRGCNNFMIGIELVGDGNKGEFSNKQMQKCAMLCAKLSKKYQIPLNQIVGHEMVSPGRKVDPGFHFDWYYFFNLMSKF